jgi:hypothetical protein
VVRAHHVYVAYEYSERYENEPDELAQDGASTEVQLVSAEEE